MKKIILLVIFSVLVFSLNAQEHRKYYESGKLSAIENYSNGYQHGVQKYYYESGKIKAIENYKDGEVIGLAKNFYESGKLSSFSNYKDGLKHGEFNNYWWNGFITQIGFYNNGKPTGVWKSYYNSGELESFGKINANYNKTGPWKYYYESGRLRKKGTYSNGELIGDWKVYPDTDAVGINSKSTNINKQESITENHPDYNSDANAYKSVKIGNQVWMSKNLNVSEFRNGDPIPHAKTNEAWDKAGDTYSPAWCYYENDSNNGAILGKLYNGYAVNDERGLAPSGWHIPSDDEWTELTDNLGGVDKAGTKMKSMSMWDDYKNIREKGLFEALPGGIRLRGRFSKGGEKGVTTRWWSSTEYWTRGLFYSKEGVTRGFGGMRTGFSVRCIKD